MSNKSKAKGTRAESKVVKYLEDNGFIARRQALAGSEDKGDLEVYAPDSLSKMIFEVKAGKQTTAPNRSQIDEWMRQTNLEAKHSDAKGFLCIVRYHRQLCDADVYWQIGNNKVLYHMYLDDWIESYK